MEDSIEEAVPFLIYDQNTKLFTLTEQGEEVIRSINSNFGVISVAGMYRTGKSYLLNRMLLNRQKGFSVGPTVNPCTKGLWIWSKPIYGTSEDGSRLPVLLIDTEGFGAFDEDQNHDIRIFTLAILLSSYFVYNSLGSIDENAIQSLSFVINLSKHIQLKTNQTETDPEELANLFPSFLWVLRDFSLQLVDDNGEQITAKEYLEKVLDSGKAFYEQEEKNKIRKLIKTFFKDRDCFTMVRPLLKEKELQSLETLGPEKLRPEFLEQILHLRKKILNRVKVKSFKGKPLNSEMFINIIKSLIESMNMGSVPNIENTWNSMCKIESYRAFEEAEVVYESTLRESLENMFGVDEDSIKKIHQEAKDKCMKMFKKKALGDPAGEYELSLKAKIKEKFSYYSKLNEEETKNNMIRVLQKWYSMIEYKIQSNELKNVNEIENDFKQLEFKLNESFPNFNLRNELFNDFKSKILNFAGDFYLNKMNNEIKFMKNENNQMVTKLTQEINEMKGNFDKELNKKSMNLDLLKTENGDLKEQLYTYKENFTLLEKEKEISGKSLQSQMERLKEEQERKLNEINSKSTNHEDKMKEAERKAITIKAEAEKEKALLEQKIEHLTKQIEDYAKREKESGIELKSQLKEQSNALRESTLKYDTNIKTLNQSNEELKEKIVDLESLLTTKDHSYETEKLRADELQNKFNVETKDLNEKLSMFKKLLAEEKVKKEEEKKNLENDHSNKLSLTKIKIDELELTTKNNEENYKNQIIKLERENAIQKQNLEFLEIKTKDLSQQMEEQKRNHENIIQSLESKTFSMVDNKEFQKKVDEIKLYYENEKKSLEESYEKSKQIYIIQIDTLTEKINESDMKGKNDLEKLEKDLNETKNKLGKMNRELILVIEEKKILNESLLQINEETQIRIKNLNEEFERKIEDKERLNQKEIQDLNKNSEETISQMKALFETEKIRFEEKVKEEKLKNEKKIKYTVEEYENKIKEIESEMKEENDNLQNDFSELDSTHQNYVSNAEHEIDIMTQKIDALESYLRDAKEMINQIQSQSTHNIEQSTENFNKERKDFLNKIENLSLESSNREKEMTQLILKRDQLERSNIDKESQINQMRKEYEEDKKDLSTKLENYKIKYQESNDEFMFKKLEYTRESALLKQQIEFLNKKIEDMQKNFEDGQKRYEERLYSLRAEVEKDLNEKFERLKREKEELDTKLLQKKKELRDLEQTFTKQSNLIEKEKTILNEKLNNLEEDKKEMTENYDKEINNLNSSLQILKNELNSTKDESVSNKDTLKKRVALLEVELQERTGQLEKEQILWEGKFKFIEQQRDNYKRELSETRERFEQMLDGIQKKSQIEKEKLENNQQSQIGQIDQKYLTQIKEMQETHHKLYTELLNSNKELDRELKSVNMQMEINKNKSIDPTQINNKIDELMEEREKLRKQIEDLKRDREIKLSDAHSFAEKEKDVLKLKIGDIENRLREVEGKRGGLLLEYEKDKAKWSLEKDHFHSKSSELQDNLDRLEKKIESLLRENEKLKSDKINNKRSSSILARNNLLNQSILGGIKDPNASQIINTTTNKDYGTNIPKPYNPTQSTNPYQKDFSKLFDGIDMNTSKIMSTESGKPFLDLEKDSNPYNKFKYSIRPSTIMSTSSFSSRSGVGNLINNAITQSSSTSVNNLSLNSLLNKEENGNTEDLKK